ncbi:TolC family protein [Aquimarina sp. 2201CG5-10]|uniref:TolC family protein n=1 Tax=Aquimarina callyspongiae TaxID=3098150 RepID=UPI002AB36879|nr:TolC family protein [Aquimarina sp. 2201CG5-10]MDY8134722.1 TolC family protein [Aquimarina sp. 2201CG5-10]
MSFRRISKYNQKSNINKKLGQFLIAFFSLFTLQNNAQTLQEYITEAEQNNPQLKALQYTYEATVEKVKESGSLPNTTIGTGYFVSEPETRTGAQKAKFSAQQKMPWFGTLKARRDKELTQSEVQKNEIEIARRKIALKVKQRYYELYSLKAKELVLKEQKQLLENYKEVAISEVAGNKATTLDVLKITIAQNELDNKIEILKGNILNVETSFNKLLDRDGFDELLVPDNLIIPEEEPTMSIDEVTYHPELLKYDHLDEVVNAQKRVNDKERLPGLSLGLDYVVVEERPNLNFDDNGKDILMPMVSLSIPLFSKKYQSKDKQFDLMQEGYLQQRESEQNRLEEILEKAINNRITARINYNTQLKNVEQTKQAEEVALTLYKTDQLKFDELIELQNMILNFEIKKIEAITNYFVQTSFINYLN